MASAAPNEGTVAPATEGTGGERKEFAYEIDKTEVVCDFHPRRGNIEQWIAPDDEGAWIEVTFGK